MDFYTPCEECGFGVNQIKEEQFEKFESLVAQAGKVELESINEKIEKLKGRARELQKELTVMETIEVPKDEVRYRTRQ